MSKLQIAWLELITVGGLGVILVLAGIISSISTKKKNKSCTKQTEGIVVQYGFSGTGRMYPIVENEISDILRQIETKIHLPFFIYLHINRLKYNGWLFYLTKLFNILFLVLSREMPEMGLLYCTRQKGAFCEAPFSILWENTAGFCYCGSSAGRGWADATPSADLVGFFSYADRPCAIVGNGFSVSAVGWIS